MNEVQNCHKCKATDDLIEFMECGTWGRTLYVCQECKHTDKDYKFAMNTKATTILSAVLGYSEKPLSVING